MGSPEKGVALARSHTHSGILADRTVSQIIGVLLTVSLCQAGSRKQRSIYRVDLEEALMNERESKRERTTALPKLRSNSVITAVTMRFETRNVSDSFIPKGFV